MNKEKKIRRWFGRIEHQGDCWIVTGVNRLNYPVFTVDGKQTPAHRAIFELVIGPLPARYDLHHECRSIHCVRPSHMRPVTKSEHVRIHCNPTKV